MKSADHDLRHKGANKGEKDIRAQTKKGTEH